MPTRRQFLRNCSIVAAASPFTSGLVLAQNGPPLRTASESPVFEHFASHLNSRFRVQTDSRSASLVLVQARRMPVTDPSAEDARNERFTLLFRGEAGQPLEQDTYNFEHLHLGQAAIFIVPVAGTGTGHCFYEAIFNRAINPRDLAAQLSQAPERLQGS